MAVFTFSTKGSRPVDTETINRIKKDCDTGGMNFSALVVRLILEWEETNGRSAKVQSSESTS